jgi:hypothetical protein
MTKELEDKLIEKYPKLFMNRNAPPTASLMCFGCECGDGWYRLLDHLFGYLTSIMTHPLALDYVDEYKNKHRQDKDYYSKYCTYEVLPPQILDQVKEKYGTLRVYYHTDMDDIPEDVWGILNLKEFYAEMEKYNHRIDAAIDYAEYQSSVTCEVTGSEGKLYSKGWFRTMCPEEAIKAGYLPENTTADI